MGIHMSISLEIFFDLYKLKISQECEVGTDNDHSVFVIFCYGNFPEFQNSFHNFESYFQVFCIIYFGIVNLLSIYYLLLTPLMKCKFLAGYFVNIYAS